MSILGGLTGSAQEHDITAARGRANDALRQGYDTGRADYSAASARFQPYADTGGNAMRMYADATGVNGQPAYDAAAKGFATGDPFRQSNEDFADESIMRAYNARGEKYGKNAMMAVARGSLERGSTDWNNWLNRLQGQGEQGFRATGAQSGIDTGKGDMAMGYGQTLAGNEISYGNAMASNRNTLTNNLVSIANAGANVAGAAYGMPRMNAMRGRSGSGAG